MQVLNLDAELNISRLDADIRTLRLGEGGTTNYNDLTNKPSINSIILTGNKTTSDLNIKTSELVNDAGFITNADIPTKTSDLVNDSGFQNAAQVSDAVAAAIPTEVSAFTNDAGYITAAQVGNIPRKTSDLDNDSGFITSAEAPVQSVNGYTGTVTLEASDIEVSAGVTVADGLSNLALSMPTKTSDLINDSGYITSLNVPSKTSDLVNDSGFVTNQIDDSTTADSTTWSSDKIVSYSAPIPQTATITDTTVASFSDGADNVPVSELIVDIDAVQSGSGTPSPSNPRAISGFSALNVTRTGKNLFNIEKWLTDNNVAFTKVGDYYKFTVDTRLFRNFFEFSVGTKTLTFEINQSETTATNIRTRVKLQDGTITDKYLLDTPYTSNIKGIALNWSDPGTLCIKTQVEAGTTATEYEPYNGGTDTISLGQTVYGGTLNVTTGLLTITHGYIEFDGSENWYYTSSLNRVYVLVPDSLKDITHSIYSNVIAFNPSYTPSDFTGHIDLRGNFEIFAPSSITNAEDWKTWVSNQNIQLVYELATPTTATLTPTEVRTLLNDNNIFADTGNINELVYFKTGCEALARLIEAYN